LAPVISWNEGQEVEVEIFGTRAGWHKAEIVEVLRRYRVQFADGTRAVFTSEYIRAIKP
jgi:hypothetical protein